LRKVTEYLFEDELGNVLFKKVRYALEGGDKTFRYYWQKPGETKWRAEKPKPSRNKAPFDADHYVLNVPQLVRNGGRPVYWCEGEKDATNVAALGLLATSHHGGAGKVFAEMGQWFVGVGLVYVVLDKDVAGMYDGMQRHTLLAGAGIRCRFLLPREGKDVTDHLEAGLGLADMRHPRVEWVARNAAKYNQGVARRLGYEYTEGA
jgi:putative DNA primase/helicase